MTICVLCIGIRTSTKFMIVTHILKRLIAVTV